VSEKKAKSQTQSKVPFFIAISDIHYSLSSMDIADFCFRAAIDKAAELGVDLIDFGDLTNDKGALRAEYVNKVLETLKYAQYNKHVAIQLIVGNHSLVNEKGSEHALNFAAPYAQLINYPCNGKLGLYFIPYQSSVEAFKAALDAAPTDTIICMHQGVQGSQMGDYVHDKSAVPAEWLEGRKWFSGHYHRHQKFGSGVYVGNPYTKTFGEAGDGHKGYLIVYTDGSYDRIIVSQRKHVIIDANVSELQNIFKDKDIKEGDLVWLKLRGPKSLLIEVHKSDLAKLLPPRCSFRLDLIPDKDEEVAVVQKDLTDELLMDKLIDDSPETEKQKKTLKGLWRTLS
jgi:hypothetical protein